MSADSLGPGPRPRNRTLGRWLWLLPLLIVVAGCAKYNTYFNAKRSFDQAENVRLDALKKHEDPPKPAGTQKADYEAAIKKAQKLLDEYPGHSLTDDALFLQAKAHYRLESYRQSIRKLNLLFQNYPSTPYMEEALYIQGLNYLLIGALDNSQEYLDRLERNYPKSKYQAKTRKVSGDNAFALKEWEPAAEAYSEYLALEGDLEDADRVGLKLAECYWELKDYYEAAEVLQTVSQTTSSAELGFRARLLRARVHVHMNDFEIVDLLLGELREEAAIYGAEGEVLLVEAESLLAQDQPEQAAPLVEGMPTEWETPAVKARAAEILGNIYLERGEWEKAREKYQAALLKKDELDEPDRVRQVNDTLKDYLAADQALPDAKGERVARLKLLQANSLLFGFDRPRMAATLYGEAAIDSAADTTVAARAYYGAYVAYDRYLDLPDSAAIFRDGLEERFPTSPQAFEARADTSTNLLGYLLAIRAEQQADNYANLSDDERSALTELGEVDSAGTGLASRPMAGVRRRQIYLSRRPNLVFPPPEAVVQQIAARRAVTTAQQAEDAARQAEFDSLLTTGNAVPVSGATGAAVDEFGNATPVPTGALEAAAAAADSALAGEQAAEQAAPVEAEAKEKDDKKKKDENWDFLR